MARDPVIVLSSRLHLLPGADMFRVGVVSAAVLAALWSQTVGAQVRAPRERMPSMADRANAQLGTIEGIVTDTSLRPMQGADVSVIGTSTRLKTGVNGRFQLVQIPPGQYLLVVRQIGFAPTSAIIDVAAADTLRLAYTLERSATVMDTVRVTGRRVTLRMLDFERRRLQGVGQFITQEDLDRRGSMAVSDFLRGVRGVEVSRITSDAFAGTVALSRREGGTLLGEGSGACPMQVLLDGIVLPRNFNLDLLPPPKQVAGVEVYSGAATVPPQFGGVDRRCGLIAVWTRDGY